MVQKKSEIPGFHRSFKVRGCPLPGAAPRGLRSLRGAGGPVRARGGSCAGSCAQLRAPARGGTRAAPRGPGRSRGSGAQIAPPGGTGVLQLPGGAPWGVAGLQRPLPSCSHLPRPVSGALGCSEWGGCPRGRGRQGLPRIYCADPGSAKHPFSSRGCGCTRGARGPSHSARPGHCHGVRGRGGQILPGPAPRAPAPVPACGPAAPWDLCLVWLPALRGALGAHPKPARLILADT